MCLATKPRLRPFVQLPPSKALVLKSLQCRERDRNMCILTGTSHPEVCHIFPFAAGSQSDKLYQLDRRVHILADWTTRPSLILTGLGASDKAWNMLSLNAQMHHGWSKGLWAFKSLGV